MGIEYYYTISITFNLIHFKVPVKIQKNRKTTFRDQNLKHIINLKAQKNI